MQPIFNVSDAKKKNQQLEAKRQREAQNDKKQEYISQQKLKQQKRKKAQGMRRRIGVALVLVGGIATYAKFGYLLPHDEVNATAQDQAEQTQQVEIKKEPTPAADAATPVAKPEIKPEAKQASTNSDPVPPPPGYANAITLDTPIVNVKSVSPEDRKSVV